MRYELGYGKVLISEQYDTDAGFPTLILEKVEKASTIGLVTEEIDLPELYHKTTIELHSLESALVLQDMLEKAISHFSECKR